MQKPLILLVDDEPDLLTTLQFRLERAGYQVETASDGQEGLLKWKELQPDLMLLDVMMPGENGYRIAKQIREQETKLETTTRTPLVLLTARNLSSDPEREQMFMNFTQADAMMYKPFEIKTLLERIESLLGDYRPWFSTAAS